MTWIYAIPAWAFMPGAVVVACAVAAALLAFVRRNMMRSEQITHNDVAGAMLTIMGTVLAVMMSFMVVGVWQEYDGSAQNVQLEAGTLSDLHHIADAFSPPARNRIKRQVDAYIRNVIAIEFPLMRSGGESLVAHNEAYDIEATITRIAPKNVAEVTAQQSALSITERFLDARRQRIHDNQQGIPLVLWSALLFIAAVTVLFSFYFRVEHPFAQYTMVIAVTAVIAVTCALIAELDYPFRGDVAISAEAFVRAYHTIHNLGLQQ